MTHALNLSACRRACTLLALTVVFATPALGAPVVFHVNLGQASATPVSGRLLVFAKVLGPDDKRPVARVDMDQIDTHATAIAAEEVAHLEPGATVELDADVTAFPTPFSQLKPGRYAVQAVLDCDHSYNYTGRGSGDLVSGVVEMDLPGDTAQLLTLTTVIPEFDPAQPRSNVPDAMKEKYAAAKADIHRIDFVSPTLSRFWGRPGHAARLGGDPTGLCGASGPALSDRVLDAWLRRHVGLSPRRRRRSVG